MKCLINLKTGQVSPISINYLGVMFSHYVSRSSHEKIKIIFLTKIFVHTDSVSLNKIIERYHP